MIKKSYKQYIAALLSVILLIGYVAFVEPSVERPTVLLGFFALVFIFSASISYILTARLRVKTLRYAVCIATPTAAVVLIARSSLGALGWGTLSLIGAIYAGIIWYVSRALAR